MFYRELKDYHYHLPPELIADRPHSPRDKARLLIYDRTKKTIAEDTYFNLPAYLPPKTVLVFNDSRVIPARILARRPTGGRLEILFLTETKPFVYQALLSRGIPFKEELTLQGGLKVAVIKQEDRFYYLKTSLRFIPLIKYLERYGQMPIPPYIKHPDSKNKLKKEYQTVFAKKYGSVAAPTASLHFTKRLLKRLSQREIVILFVTLHVGLGTFLPLTAQNLKTHTLHEEYYETTRFVWRQIQKYRKLGYRIIPVGTTSLRTLETVAKTQKLSAHTNLFIQPQYKFRIADGIITNFHLPKTSLLLLISALIGSRKTTLSLYNYAVKNKFRFYSFGDGMLVL